jgi:hypothetical protein
LAKLTGNFLAQFFGFGKTAARGLVYSSTMVINQMPVAFPHNFHSSGDYQPAYDAKTCCTDPLVQKLVGDLAHVVSSCVVSLVFGRPNYESETKSWFPDSIRMPPEGILKVSEK